VIAAIEHSHGAAQPFLYAAALLTIGVTGAYATRAWLRTFFGPGRAETPAEAPPGTPHVARGHEAPASMLWPVGVLSVPALLLGFAGVRGVDWGSAAVSLVVALLGAAIVYALWRSAPHQDPARLLGPFRVSCERAFYVDALYAAVVSRPVVRLARGVVRADAKVVDGAVRGSGRATLGLSTFVRLAQTGNAQLYVTGVVAGLLVITVAAVVLV
jgi:NADH-quinone oxidoreductase subunit L